MKCESASVFLHYKTDAALRKVTALSEEPSLS